MLGSSGRESAAGRARALARCCCSASSLLGRPPGDCVARVSNAGQQLRLLAGECRALQRITRRRCSGKAPSRAAGRCSNQSPSASSSCSSSSSSSTSHQHKQHNTIILYIILIFSTHSEISVWPTDNHQQVNFHPYPVAGRVRSSRVDVTHHHHHQTLVF